MKWSGKQTSIVMVKETMKSLYKRWQPSEDIVHNVLNFLHKIVCLFFVCNLSVKGFPYCQNSTHAALARLLIWLDHCPVPQGGYGFECRSWHIPGLRVWSLAGAQAGGTRSMFLSLINVSLSLALPLSCCLPPFLSLSNQWKYSLEWGLIYIYMHA